jgi:tRNA(Ile)-lysidine synthase
MNTRPPGEPQRKRIEAGVRRSLLDHGLPPDGRLLLAVSGGADSTALLLIMARLAKNLRLELGVAHFDHAMRGRRASRREERFVRELAESSGLPFYNESAREGQLKAEAAARSARYEFLAAVAEREGYAAVATGHTASDQAETVLLHLVRGAGLDGLAGMQARGAWPFPGHDGLTLLRPLLSVSRRGTLAYCAAACVQPIEDESNASPRYRRNRVRHELLPLLRDLNPRIDDALVRLAESAGEDAAFLRSVASEALLGAKDGSQRLSRLALVAWSASPRRHALRLALAALLGDGQELTRRHLQALERLVIEGKTGDRVDLPRGVSAVLRRDALELRLETNQPAGLPREPVALSVPGKAAFGPLLVAAFPNRPSSGEWAEVDADAVADGLCVRRRLPGDRFQPLGMIGRKKLQDFLTDAHVPRDERDRVPLFVSARGIVWVGGPSQDGRIAEWARPRPGEATVFLSFRPA